MTSPTGKLQKGDIRVVAVSAASTGNVADLSSASVTFDGITLSEGDLVLLKNQTNSEENGVYKVGSVVSGVAALSRHASMDESFEARGGYRVYVDRGTVSGGDEFVLTTNGTITIGTTSLTFTQRPTQSALTSLETRLSADESTGALSAASEYTSLTTRVSTEESSRAAADTSLTTRVSTEESARASAATSIDTVTSTETSTRASADTSLTTRLSEAEDSESSSAASLTTVDSTNLSTCVSADASLTTRVSTAESTETADVASVDTRLSTLDSQVASLAAFH